MMVANLCSTPQCHFSDTRASARAPGTGFEARSRGGHLALSVRALAAADA